MAIEAAGARTGMRTLSDEFRHASDAKILKVTRMIDLLPERGEADTLLQTIRPRLAALRPARRMNRTRLLFLPFDPVLVSGAAWRPGDPAIPRTILAPLADLLFNGTGRAMDTPHALDAACEDELTRAGVPIWAEAAGRLAVLSIPDSWAAPDWQKQNGLTMPMVRQLLPVVQLVLEQAIALRSLPPRQSPAYEPALTALLAEAMRFGQPCWGVMLSLLFAATAPDQVTRCALSLTRAAKPSPPLQAGLDQAIRDLVDRMEATRLPDPAEARLDAETVGERLELINRIEELRNLENRPAEEQRRLARLRQKIAADNRQLFDQALQERLRHQDNDQTDGALPDASVQALEAEARLLRGFALAASRLGDAEEYGRLLEQSAGRLVRADLRSGLTKADRVRLVELLIGSEKAIAALGLGSPSP